MSNCAWAVHDLGRELPYFLSLLVRTEKPTGVLTPGRLFDFWRPFRSSDSTASSAIRIIPLRVMKIILSPMNHYNNTIRRVTLETAYRLRHPIRRSVRGARESLAPYHAVLGTGDHRHLHPALHRIEIGAVIVLDDRPGDGYRVDPSGLGKGEPGNGEQQPLAVVILGGIVTSTFMNMIVIPALYLKFANVDERVKKEMPVLRDRATVAGD